MNVIPGYLDKNNRLDKYHPHKLSIDENLLSRILVKQIGTLLGFNVWVVDGRAIRNCLDVDFTTGGNTGRYSYVPNDELWIENHLSVDDMAPSLLHECVECHLMMKHGEDYSKSHDIANIFEWTLRQNIESGSVIITNLDQVCKIIAPLATTAISVVDGKYHA
jgi:hypothetical protein